MPVGVHGSALAEQIITDQDYALASEAVTGLGIEDLDELVLPSVESLRYGLCADAPVVLGGIATYNQPPELTFHLPLSRDFTAADLLRAAQTAYGLRSRIDGTVWDTVSSVTHNSGFSRYRVTAALALNDNRSHCSVPACVDQGLAFSGRTLEQQQRLLEMEAAQTALGLIGIRQMSFSQYVILQLKRIIQGRQPLDSHTTTRFYNHVVGQLGPTARFDRQEQMLLVDATPIDHIEPELGVRRVVKLRAPHAVEQDIVYAAV